MNKRIFWAFAILLLIMPVVAVANTNTVWAQTGGEDSDGDGIPDGEDQCPSEAGPAENRGCPTTTDGDRDGDGTSDSQDQCPDQGGPAQNNGCPEAETTPAPEVTEIPLPLLPQDNCYIATPTQTAVNIRRIPDIDGEIVGTLNPSTPIPALMKFAVVDSTDPIWEDGDWNYPGQANATTGDFNLDGRVDPVDFNIWYVVDNGFIFGDVVRQSGPCETKPVLVVPSANGLEIIDVEPGSTGLDKSSVKLQENCAVHVYPDGSMTIDLLAAPDGTLPQFIFRDPETLPEDQMPAYPIDLKLAPIDPQGVTSAYLKLMGVEGESTRAVEPLKFVIAMPTPPDDPGFGPMILASADSTSIVLDFPLGIYTPEPDDGGEDENPNAGNGTCEYYPPNNDNDAINGLQIGISGDKFDELGIVGVLEDGVMNYSGSFYFPGIAIMQNEILEVSATFDLVDSVVTSGQIAGDMTNVGISPYQDMPATLSFVAPETYVYDVTTHFNFSMPQLNSVYPDQIMLTVACYAPAGNAE